MPVESQQSGPIHQDGDSGGKYKALHKTSNVDLPTLDENAFTRVSFRQK